MNNYNLVIDFEKYTQALKNENLTKDSGKVTEVTGLLIKGALPGASLGSICEITPQNGKHTFLTEVVGFKDRSVLMMPLGEMRGVGLGARITLIKSTATIKVGEELLGRVIDGLGMIIDGRGEIDVQSDVPLYHEGRNPLYRRPIREPLDTGVKAINGVLTLGQGQRVGIMAGSGVGKSVLLGMIARHTKAEVNVIALIGERGREVREFIENDLGPKGLSKSVVVAVTGDQSPLIRMRGAFVATSIAEYFCRKGKKTLLMMDSITRFAMAQREIGLSVGEPPASKGYTPSVFSLMPKLLERAGSFEGEGSITGLYTVLVEGDDMDDPIGDAVRSIVDGHIVLSRRLAQSGHFPSIDVLQSSSRVMKNVIKVEQMKLAQKLRENLATFKEAEDLINIGAYKAGSNPKIDKSIKVNENLQVFLKQTIEESMDINQCLKEMQTILV